MTNKNEKKVVEKKVEVIKEEVKEEGMQTIRLDSAELGAKKYRERLLSDARFTFETLQEEYVKFLGNIAKKYEIKGRYQISPEGIVTEMPEMAKVKVEGKGEKKEEEKGKK